MPLTTYDASFDNTFAGVNTPVDDFPAVGGDGGGGIQGAVLPFSTSPGLMAGCLSGQGQDWERWAGVPLSMPGYLLPFIVSVPMPEDINASPYCTDAIQIVSADSGDVALTPYGVTLHRLTDGTRLYLIYDGGQLYSGISTPATLETGTYRIKLGDAVSEPFAIKCGPCSLLRVRLLNDTRIGDLLYGSFGFQQIFYVEGELAISYDESETRSGTDKTSGTVKKVWTLTLEDVSEPVVDALALAGLHRLVEVSYVNGSGSVTRSIQALQYEAKTQVSSNDTGGFNVTLTLPVSSTTWNAAGSATAGCVTSGSGATLTLVECDNT